MTDQNDLPSIAEIMNHRSDDRGDFLLPTIDELRAYGKAPQWFGLGFIQLKMNLGLRYHFWHPELTADVPNEEVHDHRYSFRSTLLAGSLTNELFAFIPEQSWSTPGEYELISVSCKKGDGDIWEDKGRLKLMASIPVAQGARYYLDRDTLHRTKARYAITLLKRDQSIPFKSRAMVAKKVGAPRVCPFSIAFPESDLWCYIEECLKMTSDSPKQPEITNPGYHLRAIPKGVLGKASKIVEEAMELLDAEEQGSKIMASVELSDLYGSIRDYMADRHPTLTFDDLEKMADITARAFINGRR